MADPNDSDLEWWFNCGDSLLGEKGNLSSTISALERGGGNVGAYEDTTYDRVSMFNRESWLFGREKKIRARFLTLPKLSQNVLIAFYGSGERKLLRDRFGKEAGVISLLAYASGRLATLREAKTELARSVNPKKNRIIDLGLDKPEEDEDYEAHLQGVIQRTESELAQWIGTEPTTLEPLKLCLVKAVEDLPAKELKTLEAAGSKAIAHAHKLWRATKPRKAKYVLKDYEIPLPPIA